MIKMLQTTPSQFLETLETIDCKDPDDVWHWCNQVMIEYLGSADVAKLWWKSNNSIFGGMKPNNAVCVCPNSVVQYVKSTFLS